MENIEVVNMDLFKENPFIEKVWESKEIEGEKYYLAEKKEYQVNVNFLCILNSEGKEVFRLKNENLDQAWEEFETSLKETEKYEIIEGTAQTIKRNTLYLGKKMMEGEWFYAFLDENGECILELEGKAPSEFYKELEAAIKNNEVKLEKKKRSIFSRTR